MESEWLDLAYINDKVIMHGQIQEVVYETIEQILTKEQVREVEDLMFRHRRELLTLMKGYVKWIVGSTASTQTKASTKAYHDDLDYVVDFEKPDAHGQFQKFLRNVETEGARKGQLKDQFRELLA